MRAILNLELETIEQTQSRLKKAKEYSIMKRQSETLKQTKERHQKNYEQTLLSRESETHYQKQQNRITHRLTHPPTVDLHWRKLRVTLTLMA